ncbi:DUF6712 family protein [Flammeovirga aprica]|uniref:Uncharacterized protein n=1 Tax=Flammeovirga aprica JL-4 TaxID=694437 RepID=A0A7X9P0J7_9BACT|nr:DUF6712 family protein [Flammeovirga aprica]NME67210.1 hypothetical protein [Flammeovirga aprica JL-4]
MQLLLNKDNYLDYIDVNAEIHFDTLERFVKKATHEFLLDSIFGIGNELYNELTALVTPSDKEQELIDLICTALGDYTMMCFITKHSVQVSGAGVVVVKSENTAPASDKKIEKLEKEYYQGAFTFLEKVFVFLEENKSDFDTWVMSDSYTIRNELFVSSVLEFKKIISEVKTRVYYMKLRAYLAQAETTLLRSELGTELIVTLKDQVIAKNVEEKYQYIVEQIKVATANHAFAHYLNMQGEEMEAVVLQCKQVAKEAMIAVTDTFKSDPELYPDYPNHKEEYNRLIGNNGEHDSQFLTF